MGNTKRVWEDSIYRLQRGRFHHVQKTLAYQALQHIERQKGKTGKIQIKRSEEYAREVLGWKGYAPWLKVFSALAGEFREGWIPDNYYGWVVAPRLQGRYGQSSALRRLGPAYFGEGALPDLANQVNGLTYSLAGEVLNEAALREWLFAKSTRVVFKQDQSYQGKGIHFFDQSSFDPGRVRRLGDGVWQPFIAQHSFFENLSHGATACLRVTTTTDENGISSVRACYLRLGRSGDSHVQSSSHLRVPVDGCSGRLAAHGYLTDWQAVDRHPDTGQSFDNLALPSFGTCLDKALELHAKVPFVRSVGWDLAVDTSGQVVVLEWNGYQNDIKFSEATQGPCFTGLGWENLWRERGRGTARVITGWHPGEGR